MSNWVDKYKKLIISSHKLHVIVADQDNLFEYAELRQAVEEDGFKIIQSNTDLDVRLQFEFVVRDSVEKCLIIAPPAYKPLPDILEHVNFQDIGLNNLFPKLDAKAIKGLSFNALCLLSNIPLYEELSHEKTLKFLFENLYNIDFDTLTKHKARERILNALITVFLEKNEVNLPLTNFLSGISKPYFPELVKTGLTRSNLIHFIQEHWNNFVTNGSSEIDFKESTLSKSLGYLFIFEYLNPVKVTEEQYSSFQKELRIGIIFDEEGNNDIELENILDYLKQQINTIEDLYDQWFKIIQILANAKLKYLTTNNLILKKSYLKIESELNFRFQRFIDNTYNSLFSLSGVRRPVVVSRILEHIKAQPSRRKALIVIDGMNYWQWNLLNKFLSKAKINCNVNSSLAFIPTITAWSRQAIFKGNKPDLNEFNSKEGKLFETYWIQNGYLAYQIGFKKFGVNLPINISEIGDDISILGLVCNDLDDIMHGSILGDEQLKTSTLQWINKVNILELITGLVENSFEVFITSDHGNVESVGSKNLLIREKVGAISRSKRHVQFSNEILLNDFLAQNSSIEIGTKDKSIYLKHKEAFTLENQQVITHGGSHMWEVLIPFVTINEK